MFNPNALGQRRAVAPAPSMPVRPMPSPQMRPQMRPMQAPPVRPAMGGPQMAVSDERSKKEIQRLQSANDALTQALHGRPKPEMDRDVYPSHADFPDAAGTLDRRSPYADTPAANKVAAQNVGMQAAAAAPAATPPAPPAPVGGMQPNPQQANMARSANPAFDFGAQPPDLSGLDEAYRRQGMGG